VCARERERKKERERDHLHEYICFHKNGWHSQFSGYDGIGNTSKMSPVVRGRKKDWSETENKN